MKNFLEIDKLIGFLPLFKAPLMRIYLIEMFDNKSKENYFTFIFSSHHVLFDGWSLSLMMKEINLNYNKFTYCQQKMMNISK